MHAIDKNWSSNVSLTNKGIKYSFMFETYEECEFKCIEEIVRGFIRNAHEEQIRDKSHKMTLDEFNAGVGVKI